MKTLRLKKPRLTQDQESFATSTQLWMVVLAVMAVIPILNFFNVPLLISVAAVILLVLAVFKGSRWWAESKRSDWNI